MSSIPELIDERERVGPEVAAFVPPIRDSGIGNRDSGIGIPD
jgi:hypothetical protein